MCTVVIVEDALVGGSGTLNVILEISIFSTEIGGSPWLVSCPAGVGAVDVRRVLNRALTVISSGGSRAERGGADCSVALDDSTYTHGSSEIQSTMRCRKAT